MVEWASKEGANKVLVTLKGIQQYQQSGCTYHDRRIVQQCSLATIQITEHMWIRQTDSGKQLQEACYMYMLAVTSYNLVTHTGSMINVHVYLFYYNINIIIVEKLGMDIHPVDHVYLSGLLHHTVQNLSFQWQYQSGLWLPTKSLQMTHIFDVPAIQCAQLLPLLQNTCLVANPFMRP